MLVWGLIIDVGGNGEIEDFIGDLKMFCLPARTYFMYQNLKVHILCGQWISTMRKVISLYLQ